MHSPLVSFSSWYKPRGYPHFDCAISAAQAEILVTNPAKVACWQFKPLLRYVQIGDRARGREKRNAKRRPISFPAHRDAHLYAYYASLLSAEYEKHLISNGLEDCVIAFRSLSGRSTIDHALSAFAYIRSAQNCLALAFDVTGFFDNIDHEKLKRSWCKILGKSTLPDDHYAVFRSVTKYSWIDRAAALNELKIGSRKASALNSSTPICTPQQFRTCIRNRKLIKTNCEPKGIPQGTPISALLSNIVLLDFDNAIHRAVLALGGRYWRYCDDILVVVPNTGMGIRPTIERELMNALLKVNEKKTETVFFVPDNGAQKALIESEGNIPRREQGSLQYLGLVFDGVNIGIRNKSVAKQDRRVKRAVNLAVNTKRKHNQLRAEQSLPPRPMFERNLRERHSSHGKMNFFTYARRVRDKVADGWDPSDIEHQIKRQDQLLRRALIRAHRKSP